MVRGRQSEGGGCYQHLPPSLRSGVFGFHSPVRDEDGQGPDEKRPARVLRQAEHPETETGRRQKQGHRPVPSGSRFAYRLDNNMVQSSQYRVNCVLTISSKF